MQGIAVAGAKGLVFERKLAVDPLLRLTIDLH